tara:strand:+ start:177 stop:746 length:570 start_codon:yes stop_codon:yes gene_type:complete
VKFIKEELFWPTPLWHSNILDSINNNEIKDWALNKQNNLQSVVKSNRGGWQSNSIQSEPIVKSLINNIEKFCKQLPFDIQKIVIRQMWLNINNKGDWNCVHQHGGLYDLCGTYYVKVPKNSGNIIFRDPRPGAIGSPFINKKFDHGEWKPINLHEGLLMIWPTFLDHTVEPSNSDEPRISISFDLNIAF